jgi:glycosyltransferase involved in cell wall biosynthesis
MSAQGLWEGRELAQRWFLQRATAVVTGTRAGQEELARYYEIPAERTLLLPHPTPRFALDAARGPVDADAPRRFGLETPYLLYPAQFWPHKNHVNLLRALAVLRDRDGLRFGLALVGSDKGNRALVEAETARLGLGGAVRMLGFVGRRDLVALYRHAFALAYASWCGPENLPPLEAFALGCPVVATRVPGADEQLGDAAVLVDPGDPQSIADGVKALVADPAGREQLVARGRARAERWTAADYVRGVLGFLDRFEPVLRSWRPPA